MSQQRKSRRQFLQLGMQGAAMFAAGGLLRFQQAQAAGVDTAPFNSLANLGPLGEPDENGLKLPQGFKSRVVARSGEAPAGLPGYTWHSAPDGGATFATDDGGWVYVSNSEMRSFSGGVGALRFDARGDVTDAYQILKNTSINCAGGPTPWGTWLSCEEFTHGQVYECDPMGMKPSQVRPALGTFRHDIKMTITGQHSIALTGGMDYNIQAEIPRSMLENSSLGSAANKGLDLLSKQAGNLGINLAQSEIINVGINLTGSITDPKTNVKLLGADGNISVADVAGQKAQEGIDAAKQQLEEEAAKKVEEGKEIVKETTDKIADSLKTVADQKLGEVKEEIGKKTGEILKDKAGGVLDSTAQKELDKILGKKDSSAVGDIKKELEKFNPFKKKKKKSGGG